MSTIFEEPSRTFSEFLLIPNLTDRDCIPANVSLVAPLTRYQRGERPRLTINVPTASAIMQAVSDDVLAIELARCGGIAFIYGSQSIDSQAALVRRVKSYKAGFVVSDSNLTPEATLGDVIAVTAQTGHSTVAITDDGRSSGRLLGIITERDYRPGHHTPSTPVAELMTPLRAIKSGRLGITLEQANTLIWAHKVNCLPILDDEQHLHYLVFRKDHDSHNEHPLENVDRDKRLVVGAGINSRDFRERVPALLAAGADILCIDSSDGFSEWQRDTIQHVKQESGGNTLIGAGNVVDRDGFLYLAEAGADFVKVGVGGASICITREQKGIGRGQATSVIEVSKARDDYFQRTGWYVPLCSDGAISQDYHVTLALALGADFVMMGRYFARFDEAPGRKLWINNNFVKEYWAEGSNRARNWQRYDMGGDKHSSTLEFEEGVDSYVPYAGRLKDGLETTLAKVRSTMCNCGARSIEELHQKARLTVVSAPTLRENAVHDVILKETSSGTTSA